LDETDSGLDIDALKTVSEMPQTPLLPIQKENLFLHWHQNLACEP